MRVINCAATMTIGVADEAFERCRIVVREGVGYDTLDLPAWSARGVPVCNVPDYGTTEVADHALALLLALARGTGSYQEAVRDRSRRLELQRRAAGPAAARRRPSPCSASAASGSPPRAVRRRST